MKIDGDGICNTVSVNRVTVAQAAKEMPTEDNRTETDENDSEREQAHVTHLQMKTENVPNVLPEYSMDRIGHHVGKGNSVKYVARWYCYTSPDDTIEQPAHSPQTFFTRHWRQGQNHKARPQQERKQNRGQQIMHATYCTDEHVNHGVPKKRQ